MPRGDPFGCPRSHVEFEITPATFRTLGLATIAGLRSMAAPALLASAVRPRPSSPAPSGASEFDAPNLPALGTKEVSGRLFILAVGEMAADKTPFVPPAPSPRPSSDAYSPARSLAPPCSPRRGEGAAPVRY